MEHSNKLNDTFFKQWLSKIRKHDAECVPIDAVYSLETDKIVPIQPRDPDTTPFYAEAMSHLQQYPTLLKDWRALKDVTFELNTELAEFFNQLWDDIKTQIDLPYWCSGYFGEQPDEYFCQVFTLDLYHDSVAGTGRLYFYSRSPGFIP